MKQKLSLWACAVLLATAAAPAFAGTWEPAPAGNGYAPIYGAASVGTATKTVTGFENNDTVPVGGPPLDTDGRTFVRFEWSTTNPRTDLAPDTVSGSFLWNYTGDVSQVTETSGYASARLQLFPYNRHYHRRILTKSFGAVTENEPVPQDPQPQAQECNSSLTQTTDTTSYVDVEFSQGVATDATAYYYGNPSVQGAASATSAAATISVVNNSVTVTSP